MGRFKRLEIELQEIMDDIELIRLELTQVTPDKREYRSLMTRLKALDKMRRQLEELLSFDDMDYPLNY